MLDGSRPQRLVTGELIARFYEYMRRQARWERRRANPGTTLQTTDLVNEACLHLIRYHHARWESSEHFHAIAARKMRQVTLNHLRRRNAQRRGGPGEQTGHSSAQANRQAAAHWRRTSIPLESLSDDRPDGAPDVLDLADALKALSLESRRLTDVVMLRCFAGLNARETAVRLNVSPATVDRDYRQALAWLNRRLQRGT